MHRKQLQTIIREQVQQILSEAGFNDNHAIPADQFVPFLVNVAELFTNLEEVSLRTGKFDQNLSERLMDLVPMIKSVSEEDEDAKFSFGMLHPHRGSDLKLSDVKEITRWLNTQDINSLESFPEYLDEIGKISIDVSSPEATRTSKRTANAVYPPGRGRYVGD